MKLIILVIVCFYICLISCQRPTTTEVASSVAVAACVDLTDPKVEWQRPEQIVPLFSLATNPGAACKFQLLLITDKQVNKTFTSILPDANVTEQLNTNDDGQFRKRYIQHFYTAIAQSYQSLYKSYDTTQSMQYSECFAAIGAALTFLQASQCQRKYCVITSDLMQKSSDLDAYKVVKNESSDAIASKIKELNVLPRTLTGITVIFIFQPRDRNEDRSYAKMLKAFKQVLESQGATTKIQT